MYDAYSRPCSSYLPACGVVAVEAGSAVPTSDEAALKKEAEARRKEVQDLSTKIQAVGGSWLLATGEGGLG